MLSSWSKMSWGIGFGWMRGWKTQIWTGLIHLFLGGYNGWTVLYQKLWLDPVVKPWRRWRYEVRTPTLDMTSKSWENVSFVAPNFRTYKWDYLEEYSWFFTGLSPRVVCKTQIFPCLGKFVAADKDKDKDKDHQIQSDILILAYDAPTGISRIRVYPPESEYGQLALKTPQPGPWPPQLEVESKVNPFLGVEFTSKTGETLEISIPMGVWRVGNELLSKAYVQRYLTYTVGTKLSIEDYKLEIVELVDHTVKFTELTSNQYIKLGLDSYEILSWK